MRVKFAFRNAIEKLTDVHDTEGKRKFAGNTRRKTLQNDYSMPVKQERARFLGALACVEQLGPKTQTEKKPASEGGRYTCTGESCRDGAQRCCAPTVKT